MIDWKKYGIYTGLFGAGVVTAMAFTKKTAGRTIPVLVAAGIMITSYKGCEKGLEYLGHRDDNQFKRDSLANHQKYTQDTMKINNDFKKMNFDEYARTYEKSLDEKIAPVRNELRAANNKLDEIANSRTQDDLAYTQPKPAVSATIDDNAFNAEYILADLSKKDKRLNLYAVKDSKGISMQQSPAIFARNGGPDNGLYDVSDIALRDGDLAPLIVRFNKDKPLQVISGEGSSHQYAGAISAGEDICRNGSRVNDSALLYMQKMHDRNKRIVLYVH